MQQLRSARELYSETGDRAYLSVIDAHLRTIAEVDTRRRLAEARRAALLELRQHEALNDDLREPGAEISVLNDGTERQRERKPERLGEGEIEG